MLHGIDFVLVWCVTAVRARVVVCGVGTAPDNKYSCTAVRPYRYCTFEI